MKKLFAKYRDSVSESLIDNLLYERFKYNYDSDEINANILHQLEKEYFEDFCGIAMNIIDCYSSNSERNVHDDVFLYDELIINKIVMSFIVSKDFKLSMIKYIHKMYYDFVQLYDDLTNEYEGADGPTCLDIFLSKWNPKELAEYKRDDDSSSEEVVEEDEEKKSDPNSKKINFHNILNKYFKN